MTGYTLTVRFDADDEIEGSVLDGMLADVQAQVDGAGVVVFITSADVTADVA